MARQANKNGLAILIIVFGLVALLPLQRWIDGSTSRKAEAEEVLYLDSGQAIKRMSVGLDALISEIYWIRTVQYFGRKVLEADSSFVGNTKDIYMPLLAPYLEITTTLDVHHRQAYRFGAIFLPERDVPAAIALLEKGFKHNPSQWRICQDLGYIYWQAGNATRGDEQKRNYDMAADWYDKGSKIEGAMWWMRDLAGLMKIEAGSREAALIIYSAYLDNEGEDERIKSQAAGRLKQIQALSELDVVNEVLAKYRAQKGGCPPDLAVLAPVLASAGLTLNDYQRPVDPDGFEYEYDARKCQARLTFASTVMR
jgi:rRNA processing protein Gar1